MCRERQNLVLHHSSVKRPQTPDNYFFCLVLLATLFSLLINVCAFRTIIIFLLHTDNETAAKQTFWWQIVTKRHDWRGERRERMKKREERDKNEGREGLFGSWGVPARDFTINKNCCLCFVVWEIYGAQLFWSPRARDVANPMRCWQALVYPSSPFLRSCYLGVTETW